MQIESLMSQSPNYICSFLSDTEEEQGNLAISYLTHCLLNRRVWLHKFVSIPSGLCETGSEFSEATPYPRPRVPMTFGDSIYSTLSAVSSGEECDRHIIMRLKVSPRCSCGDKYYFTAAL
jgi:hypothetical protein